MYCSAKTFIWMLEMAYVLHIAPINSFKATVIPKPGRHIHTDQELVQNFLLDSYPSTKFSHLIAKAGKSDQSSKPNSVICTNCDGNGAVVCSQCKGSGVNSVDFFNGLFKTGDSCWLCGGKKDMLCGNCNGAGFVGGFMSTFDE